MHVMSTNKKPHAYWLFKLEIEININISPLSSLNSRTNSTDFTKMILIFIKCGGKYLYHIQMWCKYFPPHLINCGVLNNCICLKLLLKW